MSVCDGFVTGVLAGAAPRRIRGLEQVSVKATHLTARRSQPKNLLNLASSKRDMKLCVNLVSLLLTTPWALLLWLVLTPGPLRDLLQAELCSFYTDR